MEGYLHMLQFIRKAYHELHVAAVIIHVLLVGGELLHLVHVA